MAAEALSWSAARLEAGFVRDRIIGRGRFGQAVLWHARRTREGEARSIVVKQVPLEALSPKEREQTANEVALLATLQHPNVIGYLGAYVDEPTNTMNLVLEYADDGTLADRIKQCAARDSKLSAPLVQRWFVQLALAVDHVHASRILHRDIKSANIFLTSSADVKLGDFGVSRKLSETRSMATTICGTPFYLAPELVRGQAYSQPADVWSLGCVLFEMLTLRRPFAGGNIGELVMNISRGKFAAAEGAQEGAAASLLESCTDDAELCALVLGMLRLDASERLTLRQVLGSRYAQEVLDPAPLPLFASCAHAAASADIGRLHREQHGGCSSLLPPPESPSASSSTSSEPTPTRHGASPEQQLGGGGGLARETSAQSDASSVGLLSPSSPSLARLGARPADLLHFRDSVSDAARRARRRRGAIDSPGNRTHIPALTRHASGSTSVYSTQVMRSPALGRAMALGGALRSSTTVPADLSQLCELTLEAHSGTPSAGRRGAGFGPRGGGAGGGAAAATAAPRTPTMRTRAERPAAGLAQAPRPVAGGGSHDEERSQRRSG